jgi:serine/threonine-protein kinase ULK/ATG1
MAPQLLKQQKYTTKCDIWSIGVIYYELLTKRLPWEGNSVLNLSKNIDRQPLKIPNNISEWSANILKRMLTIN